MNFVMYLEVLLQSIKAHMAFWKAKGLKMWVFHISKCHISSIIIIIVFVVIFPMISIVYPPGIMGKKVKKIWGM